MSPLNFLFKLTIGESAQLSSAVIGVISAIALAKAPLESLPARKALILGLSGGLSSEASLAARTALVPEAEKLFDLEKK